MGKINIREIPSDAPFDGSGIVADFEHQLGHDSFSQYADLLCQYGNVTTQQEWDAIKNLGQSGVKHSVDTAAA